MPKNNSNENIKKNMNDSYPNHSNNSNNNSSDRLYLNSDEILGNNPININPLIVNNNITPEEIKQKVNIIIELLNNNKI